MSNKIRVGVIGVGNMGRHHARIYSEMENVELTGLVDIQKDLGEGVARKLQTDYYVDYKDLFAKVDAVNIAVPTNLHHQIAKDFLSRNIHVMIEKPITTDLSQAKELIDMANGKDMILQVGHLERFNPAMLMFKKLINEPLFIEAQRMSFPTNRNLDVGIVWDLMVHDLDILLNIVKSDIKEIQATGISVYSDFEDLAIVKITFKNGCVAQLLSSRVSGEKLRQMKVIENGRTLLLDFINQAVTLMKPPMNGKPNTFEHIYVEKDEPLRLELAHFIECVSQHKTPMVSGEDGKRALELAMQIVSSMKTVKRNRELAEEYLAMTKN
ncbi:MAG: Gfo/Idh/MocA family oxidoreductase [Armatimonadota bacterium]